VIALTDKTGMGNPFFDAERPAVARTAGAKERFSMVSYGFSRQIYPYSSID